MRRRVIHNESYVLTRLNLRIIRLLERANSWQENIMTIVIFFLTDFGRLRRKTNNR